MPFPLNESPSGQARVSARASRLKPLVLVAEHHDDTRSMLRAMLTLEGFDVAESTSGDGTLAAVASLSPDVILLDGALPHTDGLMVAKRLRADDAAVGTRIVFVSGRGGRALERSVYAAGCDSFLLKPLDFDQLLLIVRRLAGRAARAR